MDEARSEMIVSVHDLESRYVSQAGRLALDEVKDLNESIFQEKAVMIQKRNYLKVFNLLLLMISRIEALRDAHSDDRLSFTLFTKSGRYGTSASLIFKKSYQQTIKGGDVPRVEQSALTTVSTGVVPITRKVLVSESRQKVNNGG